MAIKMAVNVAFANIFMARIENLTFSSISPYSQHFIFSLLPTSSPRFLLPPYFSGPFLPPSYSALLGADVNLQKVEGGLCKSSNSDESGYVNYRLL